MKKRFHVKKRTLLLIAGIVWLIAGFNVARLGILSYRVIDRKWYLYAISGNANGYHMTRMVAAIIISFGCYLPVTLFSKTKPKVGLLMIPKTCAYMWIIAMGLQLLF